MATPVPGLKGPPDAGLLTDAAPKAGTQPTADTGITVSIVGLDATASRLDCAGSSTGGLPAYHTVRVSGAAGLFPALGITWTVTNVRSGASYSALVCPSYPLLTERFAVLSTSATEKRIGIQNLAGTAFAIADDANRPASFASDWQVGDNVTVA